jgi:hypothetical protein
MNITTVNQWIWAVAGVLFIIWLLLAILRRPHV